MSVCNTLAPDHPNGIAKEVVSIYKFGKEGFLPFEFELLVI
jgi:hypothetical protein